MPHLAPPGGAPVRRINHKPEVNRNGESPAVGYPQTGTDAGNFRAFRIARERVYAGNITSVIKNQCTGLDILDSEQLAQVRRIDLDVP